MAQRQKFFQTVRDLGERTATVIPSWPNAATQDTMDLNIGRPGCIVVLAIATREPSVYCSFYIRNDKALFAGLETHRGEIEGALGAVLEWRSIPTIKSSQVILHHSGDWRDGAFAPDLAQWLVTTADRFAQLFRGYL